MSLIRAMYTKYLLVTIVRLVDLSKGTVVFVKQGLGELVLGNTRASLQMVRNFT
jgi:hypothetical protein